MAQLIHKRIPHIMKKKKDVHHPSNFFFFDTETRDKYRGKKKGNEQHELWFGCVWAFRYEDQQVTRAMKASFDTTDEFYYLVQKRLDPSRPLYIVAHNLGFDLTIVDFWDQADQHGMDCLYAVLEDPPLFLSYQWHGCKIIFIDTFNFWKCSVADMGKSLGLEKLEIDLKTATRKQAQVYCERDVEIIANQLISFLDFLSDESLGSFGISAPAVAMNTFKKRFMTHEIFIHDRTKVLQLERQCYYGGLVHNFYIGRSRGETVYHTDVNSLYPSVMLANYPSKLITEYRDVQTNAVANLLIDNGGCATVLLESRDETYPKRFNGRLCEVRGRIETSLCGQELQRAITAGHVKHIKHLAVYEMAPVFKDYVEYFWAMRQTHSKPKGNPKEQLIKLLMNSLYGKFGMKGFDWVDFTPQTLEAYYDLHNLMMPDEYRDEATHPVVNGHTDQWHGRGLERPISVRFLAGKLQLKMPTGEHSESFCAIAAFVTSYARERLRGLIKTAGHKNVFYCDTDSLFVNQPGYVNLCDAGEVQETQLGKLKLESQSSSWQFFGPKDYTFGKKKVAKGIRKNATEVSPGVYEQLQFEGLKSVLNRGGEGFITIKMIRKHNKREYTKGTIGKGGWTEPFVLSDW